MKELMPYGLHGYLIPEKLSQCPKCGAVSGDAWLQCEGKCPLPHSPHYDRKTHETYGEPDIITKKEAFDLLNRMSTIFNTETVSEEIPF